MTSTPEVSKVRTEVKEKSDLSDSSVVNKQSPKPVVGSVTYPKKRCFMKDCEMHVTHLRRYLVGCHLPPCSALKDEMPLSIFFLQTIKIYLPFCNNIGARQPWEGEGSKPSIKVYFQCHFIHSMKNEF